MRESKILLFGFSRSAIEIGTRLQEQGLTFTCIDNDANLLPKAKKLGFDIRITDYSDDETLLNLGIGEDVGFVFTLFEEDVQNVFLTMPPSIHQKELLSNLYLHLLLTLFPPTKL